MATVFRGLAACDRSDGTDANDESGAPDCQTLAYYYELLSNLAAVRGLRSGVST